MTDVEEPPPWQFAAAEYLTTLTRTPETPVPDQPHHRQARQRTDDEQAALDTREGASPCSS